MNSSVVNLQLYLQSLELVDGSTGWPSVRRREHDESDNRQVILTEDGGPAPEVGGVALKAPAVQVRVRAEPFESDEAFNKLQEITEALHGLNGVTMGDRYYLGVSAQNSEPVFTGYDNKNRPHYTASFRLTTGVVVESA